MSTAPLVMVYEVDDGVIDMLADLLALIDCRVIALTAYVPPFSWRLRNGPDMVILDMMLNGPLNGIEYAAELQNRGVACPIIAMTASPMTSSLARESGIFAAVIDKPMDLNDTLRTIQKLLPEPEIPAGPPGKDGAPGRSIKGDKGDKGDSGEDAHVWEGTHRAPEDGTYWNIRKDEAT